MTWRRSDPSDPEERKRGVTKNALITRKVCLNSLPGGSWECPCEGPPRSTEATPPSPRHTHEARPKTAPLAHRRGRREDPKPHWSRTGATAAPRTGRGSTPPSSEATGSDASTISASAATGGSTARTATTSAEAGASAGNTSGGPKATAAPAASPGATAVSTEESASGASPTATGAA
jgi:hypothetical protein